LSLSPLELTPSRRRVLELLHHYRYLTPRLLAVAYAHERQGRGLWHVRHELGLLWRHGLVERHYHATRPNGEGSEQFIYTIGAQGGRAALDPETYARDRRLIYRRCELKRGNYDHHLALASLQLILELGGHPWTVESFRCDERSERSRLSVRLDGRAVTVQPDAWATLSFPNGQQALYLFEVDLARKNNERIDSRFEAYASYLVGHAGTLRAREAVNNVVVVFVAPGAAEVERLRARATPILRRWSRRERPLFLFWNQESWHETQELARRQDTGAPEATRRTWSVQVLRAPHAILREPSLSTIHGDRRGLVQPAA
jgi:hypothetical protein